MVGIGPYLPSSTRVLIVAHLAERGGVWSRTAAARFGPILGLGSTQNHASGSPWGGVGRGCKPAWGPVWGWCEREKGKPPTQKDGWRSVFLYWVQSDESTWHNSTI